MRLTYPIPLSCVNRQFGKLPVAKKKPHRGIRSSSKQKTNSSMGCLQQKARLVAGTGGLVASFQNKTTV
jgi:hypothetical protein